MRLIDDNVRNKIKSHYENYELEDTRELHKQIKDIENDIEELTDPDNWDYFEEDYQGDIEHLKLETSKYVSQKYLGHTKKGQLSENVWRLADKYNWRVEWLANDKYKVLLQTEISGSDFASMMNLLMQNYPLRVSYDNKKHVMTVRNK